MTRRNEGSGISLPSALAASSQADFASMIPELQLKDEELFDARLQEIIDAAVLEPEQEQKLERDFARKQNSFGLAPREEMRNRLT